MIWAWPHLAPNEPKLKYLSPIRYFPTRRMNAQSRELESKRLFRPGGWSRNAIVACALSLGSLGDFGCDLLFALCAHAQATFATWAQ